MSKREQQMSTATPCTWLLDQHCRWIYAVYVFGEATGDMFYGDDDDIQPIVDDPRAWFDSLAPEEQARIMSNDRAEYAFDGLGATR